ncbi:MAG: ABC transporter substrate-binding protein [Eubacteriales bacterium]
MKKKLMVLMSVMLLLTMFGCSSDSEPIQVEEAIDEITEETVEASEESEEENSQVALVDRAGNAIEPLESYTTIISYAPSLTEILVDLGYADAIVAITNVDTTEGLSEEVVLFDMMNPDLELMTALAPDLILSTELTAAGQSDPFADLIAGGTTVANIPTATTIADIYLDIEFMGELLSVAEKADVLIEDMQSDIANITERVSGVEEKKSVYFEISAAPYMFGTGVNTYLSEMIELAGGVNALGDVESWIATTDEMIVAANPDVILTNVNYIDAPVEEIMGRNGWDVVTAVANAQVHEIDNMSSSLPNHNIVKALNEMVVALYPELME